MTDLDISRIVGCDRPIIEVRVDNICTERLDDGSFDLIRRDGVEHSRRGSRRSSSSTSRCGQAPGLLLEDFDFSAWLDLPQERLLCEPRELYATMNGLAAATTGTWDAEFGRDLPLHLLDAVREDVGGEVCTPINIGGSPQSEFLTLSARQASTFVVDTGLVSQADWEE